MTQRFHFQDAPGRAMPIRATPSHSGPLTVHVHYHDQAAEPASAATCSEQADAGRIRFAKAPENNEYPGGSFRDVQKPDQQSERTEALWRDPRTAASGEGPPHCGMYSPPSANANTHAGLNTPVVAGPRTDRHDIGFSGAALAPGEYDPLTNLSTVQPRGETLGNHTANGMAGFKRQGGMAGPPVLETADARRLRSINDRNRKFWQGSRDADPDREKTEEEAANESQVTPAEHPDENGPSVTRWAQQNPDGSRIVHTREIHTAPKPQPVTETTDRRRPQLPRLASAGGRSGLMAAGRVTANREAAGISVAALVNARNRALWR